MIYNGYGKRVNSSDQPEYSYDAICDAIAAIGPGHNIDHNSWGNEFYLRFTTKRGYRTWIKFSQQFIGRIKVANQLRSWYGGFTTKNLHILSIDSFLDRQCRLTTYTEESNLKDTCIKFKSLARSWVPFGIDNPWIFNIEQPDTNFDKLPKFIQDRIKLNDEQMAIAKITRQQFHARPLDIVLDSTVIHFGPHKGTSWAGVPSEYLEEIARTEPKSSVDYATIAKYLKYRGIDISKSAAKPATNPPAEAQQTVTAATPTYHSQTVSTAIPSSEAKSADETKFKLTPEIEIEPELIPETEAALEAELEISMPAVPHNRVTSTQLSGTQPKVSLVDSQPLNSSLNFKSFHFAPKHTVKPTPQSEAKPQSIAKATPTAQPIRPAQPITKPAPVPQPASQQNADAAASPTVRRGIRVSQHAIDRFSQLFQSDYTSYHHEGETVATYLSRAGHLAMTEGTVVASNLVSVGNSRLDIYSYHELNWCITRGELPTLVSVTN